MRWLFCVSMFCACTEIHPDQRFDAGSCPIDGTECGDGGICAGGECAPSECGDGFLDPRTEVCDDGNAVDDDGCTSGCVFTCDDDGDCPEDGNVCNGVERCGTAEHHCVSEPPTCDDRDPCTADLCDATTGCAHAPIDGDGDGWPPATFGCGLDCNDGNANIYPGAIELCDEIDQDCDGENVPPVVPDWFVDCDDDGFAASGARRASGCAEPAASECGGGWTARPPGGAEDCDDADPTHNPGGTEICDALDEDEDCNPVTFGNRDRDGDGHVDQDCCNVAMGPTEICGDDCDDDRMDVSPAQVEVCDTIDNDCDGLTDENAPTFYLDMDGDGYGTSASAIEACAPPPGPYVLADGDCCDADADVFPAQAMSFPEGHGCGGFDYDCDGAGEAELGIGSCSGTTASECAAFARGFVSAPACGSAGSFIDGCTLVASACEPTIVTRTQRCR